RRDRQDVRLLRQSNELLARQFGLNAVDRSELTEQTDCRSGQLTEDRDDVWQRRRVLRRGSRLDDDAEIRVRLGKSRIEKRTRNERQGRSLVRSCAGGEQQSEQQCAKDRHAQRE